MRVKEAASDAASSGFLPVRVDLILSNQPKEARCGVEDILREWVRRWSARQDAISGEPPPERWGDGFLGGVYSAATKRRNEWKMRKMGL
jgi:hypothetical protein